MSQQTDDKIPYSPFKDKLQEFLNNDHRKLLILLIRMNPWLLKENDDWFVPKDIALVIQAKADYMMQPDYEEDDDDKQVITNYIKEIKSMCKREMNDNLLNNE